MNWRAAQQVYHFAADPAVQKAVTPTPATDADKTTVTTILGPVISGGIMGLVVYSIARSFEVDAAKSRGIGITVGLTTAAGQIASSWLRGMLAKAGQTV